MLFHIFTTQGNKGQVLAVDVINNSDTGDGKETKDTKGKSVPTANAEELSRALTKSFRYNLVFSHRSFRVVILDIKDIQSVSRIWTSLTWLNLVMGVWF